jgi:hypothetical protein
MFFHIRATKAQNNENMFFHIRATKAQNMLFHIPCYKSTEHVIPYSMLQKHRTCFSIFHAAKAQQREAAEMTYLLSTL